MISPPRRRRARALAVVLLALCGSCSDGTVALHRGELGPAAYRVELHTGGPAAVESRAGSTMLVEPRADGATVRLESAGERPIELQMTRSAQGRLELTRIEGIPPTSAGEADLAAIAGQLDPPLPDGRVALGDTWRRSRRIRTDTLDAAMRTTMRAVRFRRVAGRDALELGGTVAGRVTAAGQTGTFEGAVSGTVELTWSLREGRLVSSRTRLVWTIPGTGDVVVETTMSPA